MSVSGISSNDQIYQMLYQTQNSTLNSVNSQSASNLQSTQGTQSTSSFEQMMQSLGTDLQSGNLQNTQQDFNQLQQLLQGAGSAQNTSQTQVKHHHHHHHGGGSGSANSSTSASSNDTSTTSSSTAAASFLSNSVQTPQAVSSVSQGQSTSTTA